ncbi:uncharacterized protein PFL1_05410 [Pseudozyma flocculosa PF-1]|uniref:3-beta hydroxysteroid dehydrogenase/isomerase domain-containing protein n=1 Tax=Pseudozyma flocculosa PF-1 TaxID=1277687 RepID=A0A061H427_9BASI|nr:uncharacterized protein PFL1_05410 [Pseudozyma flocculosa PF-1]EPQ27129.1 hypothetical protein PFL1_05410 [Pseudozyma flocculosa PF-1]
MATSSEQAVGGRPRGPSISIPPIEPSAYPSAVVVVTQAASFPGLHVVRELLSLKAHVRAVVASQDEANDVADAFVGMGQALRILLVPDPWVPGRFDDIIKGSSHLVHFVSPRECSYHGNAELDMLTPAVEGSCSILQSAIRAGGLEWVALVSSVTALGDYRLSPTELNYNDLTRQAAGKVRGAGEAHMLFAACNAMAEQACWQIWETHRLQSDKPDVFGMTSLLPVNICGPEVVPRAMRDDNLKLFHAVQGRYMGGEDRGFWVDVRDVAMAACEALFGDISATNGRRYILSAGQAWLPELGAMIRMEKGIPLPDIDISLASSSLRTSASTLSAAPGSDTHATSSEPATPTDPHTLHNLDVGPSIHDLEVVYGSLDFAVRDTFDQLRGTEWGERLGIVDRRGGNGRNNRSSMPTEGEGRP